MNSFQMDLGAYKPLDLVACYDNYIEHWTSGNNAARLPVTVGHKQPCWWSPSSTKTVRGMWPLLRPTLTSSLTKAVPCLLSRDLLFFQAYRKLSYSLFSLLAPLGVTPNWALVLWPPITLHLMVAWSLTYHFPLRSRPHHSAGYA